MAFAPLGQGRYQFVRPVQVAGETMLQLLGESEMSTPGGTVRLRDNDWRNDGGILDIEGPSVRLELVFEVEENQERLKVHLPGLSRPIEVDPEVES